MPLPPRWVRRVLVAPAVVVGAVILVTTLPVWLLVATGLTALVPGYLRLPRVLWMVTFYLLWDSAALVSLFGLWVASGFGWRVRSPAFQRTHYVLAGWFLRQLFRQARWVLRLRIDVEGDVAGGGLAGHPIVLASRHAGPGDSFILVHALLNWFEREPRIVLKDTLQWDPAVDVMLNRLPNRFIAPTPFGAPRRVPAPSLTDQVGQLAHGLDANDAFVIFPEGGNFTAERRRRRIEGLRREGRTAMAARAEAMRHVMAPRPGGILAALDAAPDAGVVFVAHTGLDRMVTVGDVWRELPMDKRIVMHGWQVPRDEIPLGREERIEWLYGWWERIDAWVAARSAALADGSAGREPAA
ncbi:1-acyl-sn-glycerol-3-phosphate acyltransferase [Georgenia daeguensis]|uniref:Phospholipid/glycerol acyltransferase domain-containing protein n=1 Tax=Georgenia daeguensis TaxID=908355 RepID=A0ABP8ETM2_9MICO